MPLEATKMTPDLVIGLTTRLLIKRPLRLKQGVPWSVIPPVADRAVVWSEFGWGIRVYEGGRVNTLKKRDGWASAIESFTCGGTVRSHTYVWRAINFSTTLRMFTNRLQGFIWLKKAWCVHSSFPKHSDTPTKLMSGHS